MKTKKEKFADCLNLFGLREDFTMEELSSAYRTLAKLNHPDIFRGDGAEEKMAIINEAYEFLKDVSAGSDIDSLKSEVNKKKKEDIFYSQYKKGFLILKKAFEDYFGESVDKKNFRDEAALKEQLKSAKNEFSKLVNDLPYNEWVNDAIDRISSINKWLG